MSILPATPAHSLRTAFESQRLPLLIVLGITLLAKGGALLPGYSIDDYQPASDGPHALLGDVLAKGRVGHWLFLKAAMALQIEPNGAHVSFVSFSILAYAVFGLAVVRFWRIEGNGWLPVVAACIVANHPYTCEIFTFRVGLPLASFVMALLAFLLFLATRPRLHLVLGSLTFALALSFYPIALHFGFMIVLMGVAIEGCRWLEARGALDPGERPAFALDRRHLLADRVMRLFLFIVVGVVAYTLAGALFGRLIRASGEYFATLPPGEIPQRAWQAGKHVVATFVRPNALIPPAIQVVFALVLVCIFAGLLRMALRRPVRGYALVVVAGIAVLLGCALLWSVGVLLLRQLYWPVPRTMAHVGIFWAGCLVIAAGTAPRPWIRRGLGMAAAAILLSFVGVNQHIFDDQWRLNRRDQHKANRILLRLEALPGFEEVQKVAFVGRSGWYPLGMMRTQWGDMNTSAFGPFWSQVSLLREVSGYDVGWFLAPQERAAADGYCAHAEPWPAPDSVAIRGGLGIVCLAKSSAP